MRYVIGDNIGLFGQYVITDISEDYRTFTITTSILGGPTGPTIITFDSYKTEADINAFLAGLPA